jgi:enediyne biosynthesis protein E7
METTAVATESDPNEPRTPPVMRVNHELGATQDSFACILEGFRRFGDVFQVQTAGRANAIWVVSHPDDVKRVLVSNQANYTKGTGLERVKMLLGNGLIVSEGAFWRRQRRMIQPAFHPRVLANFEALIGKQALSLSESWERKAASGEPVNVTSEMSAATLDIVLAAIFSEDLPALRQSGNESFDILTETSARNLQFAMKFRALTGLIRALIVQRRNDVSRRFDFLSMLLDTRDADTGESMVDDHVVDEITTLIVAGHETTASTLNWAWALLARNPDCEVRLHEEIDRLPSPAVRFEDAGKLPYTDGVIQESLRLYPPVWLLTRKSTAKDQLGGYYLPAGTDVFISPYLLHRRPDVWDQPDRFDPERFSPAADSVRHRYAFIPFSMGARRCIGEGFALAEMRVLIAMLAKRFRLRATIDEPLDTEAEINLRIRRPLLMQVECR